METEKVVESGSVEFSVIGAEDKLELWDKTHFEEDDSDFSIIFDQDIVGLNEHQVIVGRVLDVGKDYVTIDINYKSEGLVPVEEFFNVEGVIEVSVGDEVEVFLESSENSEGMVVLSRDKAKKLRVWEEMERIYEQDETVFGVISSRIKGGLFVDVGIKAFLPGSQVDLRPVRNLDKLIGEKFEFKILKFNKKRGNIVLSRRVLLEVDREEQRQKTLEVLQEGTMVKGVIKNMTNYGAFIDLGGVDGLLHITDMSWGRISHPSDVFNMGDEIEVLVLKYDKEESKVSLGYKQKQQNPWDVIQQKYAVGTRVQGKVVSMADYGAFVELEPGVEGLIHISEMSWTQRVHHPSRLYEMGDMIEALVKDLDVERKRISLSAKEAQSNPWQSIEQRYPVGSIIRGKVRNITDFGLFIGLEEGIDGLLHISDLAWSRYQCKPSLYAKKGEDIEVKVLYVDPDKKRISLGLKQMSDDPWQSIEDKLEIGAELEGRIVNVTEFGFFVELVNGVEGLVHISELGDAVSKENLARFYPVESKVQVKLLKISAEERRLGLALLEQLDANAIPPEDNAVLEGAMSEVENTDVASSEEEVDSNA